MIFRLCSSSFKLLSSQSLININKCMFASTPNLQLAQEKLKQIVDSEIKYEEEHPCNLKSFQKYFTKQGWTVKYKGAQVQIQKIKRPFTIHVVFNAKRPIVLNETPQSSDQKAKGQDPFTEGQQQDNKKGELEISQTTVCIKRDGSKKWMIADYFSIPDNGSELGNIFFITDIDKFKAKLAQNRGKQKNVYESRNLGTIQAKIQQSLALFVESLGLDQSFFQQTASLGFAYQQKFYIDWLKDLRTLV